MSRFAFSLLFLTVLPFSKMTTVQPRHDGPAKIQVALLLDTSNSMDGLIDQAKAQLWKMVNKLSNASKQGQDVVMEIALYEYGNDNLNGREGYIRMVQPFGMDLDGVSDQLFKLKTNGGNEYCGWVIKDALEQLDWSDSPGDLRIVVIAGNEPFDQGGVDYRESCKSAAGKGVIVNTIHCGDYETGIRTHWKDGAVLGLGRYLNIDTDEKVVHIPTPYDTTIIRLNEALNKTYIGYGREGESMKSRQMEQDANAATYGASNVAQRATAKAKKSYSNANWDLVDAAEADSTLVDKLKNEDLPEELKGKSKNEIKAEIERLKAQRTAVRAELLALESKMESYIAAERAKIAGTQTLDNVLIEAIVDQAKARGFGFEE